MTSLRQIWRHAWTALTPQSAEDALFTALLVRYTEAHRHYHTLQHLQECMESFESAAHLAQHPHEVAIALWFHDAIYDTHAHNNEQASAAWAAQALVTAGASSEVCARVHALILATQHSAAPSTPDAALLIDIDLSILGASAMRFAEYEMQIQREYHFVDPVIFNIKRTAILQGFLAREKINTTSFFNEKLEARARENLKQSIQKLG